MSCGGVQRAKGVSSGVAGDCVKGWQGGVQGGVQGARSPTRSEQGRTGEKA